MSEVVDILLHIEGKYKAKGIIAGHNRLFGTSACCHRKAVGPQLLQFLPDLQLNLL